MAFATTSFYALLCAVCLWCAAHSAIRDRRDSCRAALILAAGCILSNFAWAADLVGSWVRIDAVAMIAFLLMLWRDRRPWKLQLAIASVAVMGAHAIFSATGDGTLLKLYGYPATLNALLIVQLYIVGRDGAKGARDAGADWLVSIRARGTGGYSRLLRRRSDR